MSLLQNKTLQLILHNNSLYTVTPLLLLIYRSFNSIQVSDMTGLRSEFNLTESGTMQGPTRAI